MFVAANSKLHAAKYQCVSCVHFCPKRDCGNIVLILHTDEGAMGKYHPEYQFSLRVAKPRVMQIDMRDDILSLLPNKTVCNITIITDLEVSI